jgi:hypothetical protein
MDQRVLSSPDVQLSFSGGANKTTTAKHTTHKSRHIPTNGPVIYFVRCEGFVKIGFTANAHERMGTLRTASPFPLVLLGWLPGNADLEAAIQRRLAIHRERGEWFRLHKQVAAFISECVARGNPTKRASNLERWLRAEAQCPSCGGRKFKPAMAADGMGKELAVLWCRSCDFAAEAA